MRRLSRLLYPQNVFFSEIYFFFAKWRSGETRNVVQKRENDACPRLGRGSDDKNAILRQKTFSALSRSTDRCAEKKRWFTEWPPNVKIAYRTGIDVYVLRPFHQLRLPHGSTTSVDSPDISLFVTPQVNDMRKFPGVFAFRGAQGRRQDHFPRLLSFSKHSRKMTGAVGALIVLVAPSRSRRPETAGRRQEAAGAGAGAGRRQRPAGRRGEGSFFGIIQKGFVYLP